MPCDLLGLGLWTWIGIGGLVLCTQDLCVQSSVGVMCYLMLSVRKPTPNPFVMMSQYSLAMHTKNM